LKLKPPASEKEIPLPILWDHHGHLSALGAISEALDLRGVGSPGELLRKIEARAAASDPGEWISGFGWDQNLWGGRLPSINEIDNASGSFPLFLKRIDCHAAMANNAALRLACAGEQPFIRGGEFVKGRAGRWTGIVLDNAMAPFAEAMSAPSRTKLRKRMKKAFGILRSAGLSGATDMQMNDEEIAVLSEMDSSGEMDFCVAGYREWKRGEPFPREFHRGDKFVVAGMKIFLDGALGSRGAALSRPYSDDPGSRGLLLATRKEILEILEEARERKAGLAFHAIGDRALGEFLAAFERLEGAAPPVRLEHLQVTPPPLLRRLRAVPVTVSLQPCHFLSDREWAEERLGPRRFSGSYLLKSITEGKRYLLGTDFPIESPDPARTIAAALSRPRGERLTLAQTLKGMACPARFRKFGHPAVLSRSGENPKTGAGAEGLWKVKPRER